MQFKNLLNGILSVACLCGLCLVGVAEEAKSAEAAVAVADEAAKTAEAEKAAAEKAAAEAARKAAEEARAAAAVKADAMLAYIPEVVVTIGDKTVVTREKLAEMVKPQLVDALAAGQVQLSDEMVHGFVYQMANMMGLNEVVTKAAKDAGFKPDEAAVKQQLDAAAAQCGGEDKLDEQLKRAGVDKEFFMEKIREQSMVAQYQEKILSGVKVPEVTEEEVKKFYESNKAMMTEPATLSASHILVQFPSQKPTDDEKKAALDKLLAIKAKLADDGSNFAELAEENSDCPSKEKGGDLGKFRKGDMVAEFEEALLKLKPGEVSEPVETIFGYHLIKAGESTAERTVPFEEAKDELKTFLEQQAAGQARQSAWMGKLDELKAAAGFKCLLPEPKAPEAPQEGKAAETPKAE